MGYYLGILYVRRGAVKTAQQFYHTRAAMLMTSIPKSSHATPSGSLRWRKSKRYRTPLVIGASRLAKCITQLLC